MLMLQFNQMTSPSPSFEEEFIAQIKSGESPTDTPATSATGSTNESKKPFNKKIIILIVILLLLAISLIVSTIIQSSSKPETGILGTWICDENRIMSFSSKNGTNTFWFRENLDESDKDYYSESGTFTEAGNEITTTTDEVIANGEKVDFANTLINIYSVDYFDSDTISIAGLDHIKPLTCTRSK